MHCSLRWAYIALLNAQQPIQGWRRTNLFVYFGIVGAYVSALYTQLPCHVGAIQLNRAVQHSRVSRSYIRQSLYPFNGRRVSDIEVLHIRVPKGQSGQRFGVIPNDAPEVIVGLRVPIVDKQHKNLEYMSPSRLLTMRTRVELSYIGRCVV